MRLTITALGVLLLSIGLAGLTVLGLGPRTGLQLELTRIAMRAGVITAPPSQLLAPLSVQEVHELTQVTSAGGPTPTASTSEPVVVPAAGYQPPRRLRVPRIRLDAEVVPARLVRLGAGSGTNVGAVTWEVPAHRVGHAQGTADAGAPGNTVLVGHVSSINAGNVFAELDRIQAGDEISLDGELSFLYRVTEVRRVPRDDLSVMAPADGAVLTLITCTGAWLPDALDYSHRLTVHATLVP